MLSCMKTPVSVQLFRKEKYTTTGACFSQALLIFMAESDDLQYTLNVHR